jgi:hypothetical protein
VHVEKLFVGSTRKLARPRDRRGDRSSSLEQRTRRGRRRLSRRINLRTHRHYLVRVRLNCWLRPRPPAPRVLGGLLGGIAAARDARTATANAWEL